MAKCTNCAAEVPPGHKFCLHCGTAAPAAPPPQAVPAAGWNAPQGAPPPGWGVPQGAPPQGWGMPQGAPPPGWGVPPAMAKPRRSGLRILLVILPVAFMAAIGVVIFLVVGRGCSKAEGTVEASGPPLGDFVMKPNRCASGQHQGFRGVILTSGDSTQRIQVVEDPIRGSVVQIAIPSTCSGGRCEVLPVTSDDCDLFSIHIGDTNTTVNNIRVVEGFLKLDCSFEAGGSLKADVTFTCD